MNLDPEESKIYVGGHPASAKIQSAVKYSSFDGQMENLVIGETPVSLWNFKDAEYTQGAQGRLVLVVMMVVAVMIFRRRESNKNKTKP